jgi:hypothetical protein
MRVSALSTDRSCLLLNRWPLEHLCSWHAVQFRHPDYDVDVRVAELDTSTCGCSRSYCTDVRFHYETHLQDSNVNIQCQNICDWQVFSDIWIALIMHAVIFYTIWTQTEPPDNIRAAAPRLTPTDQPSTPNPTLPDPDPPAPTNHYPKLPTRCSPAHHCSPNSLQHST